MGRVVVLAHFPIEIAQSESQVGRVRICFGSNLKLRDGFRSPAQTIQRLSCEHVSGARIRMLLRNPGELIECTRIVLRGQAALRQYAVEFRVPGVGLYGRVELYVRFLEPSNSVIT